MPVKTHLLIAAALLVGLVTSSVANFVKWLPGQGEVDGCLHSSNVCVGMTYAELAAARPTETLGGVIIVQCGRRPTASNEFRDVTEALLVSCAPAPSTIVFSNGHVRTALYLRDGRVGSAYRSWANPLEL